MPVLVGGGWVETESLLTRVEEEGQPIPRRAHKSPLELGDGVSVVEGDGLVCERGEVETVSLLTEVEDEGQPIPRREQSAPVVEVVSVVEGGWVDWERSLVVLVFGVSLVKSEDEESVDEGVGVDEGRHNTPRPRRPQESVDDEVGEESVEDNEGVVDDKESDDTFGLELDDVDAGDSDEVEVSEGVDDDEVSVGVGDDEVSEGVDEVEVSGGGDDDEGFAGKVVVTPFITAMTRPSGVCPRVVTTLPGIRSRRRTGNKYASSNLLLWTADLLRLTGVDGR